MNCPPADLTLQRQPPCPPPAGTPGPQLQVMLVDDNQLVRLHLRLLLEKLPGVAIVHEAADVPEAIEAHAQRLPDVLVLDLQMPGGSGLEVLEHVRRTDPECLVIILSGSLDPQSAARCRAAGAAHCFDKALEFEKVLHTIRSLLPATINRPA